MARWIPFAALWGALAGCTPDTGTGWRGGGDPIDGDDTGSAPDDDTGGCAPQVTEYDAHFEEYPNVGWVIEVVTGYADRGCTLEGGAVELKVGPRGQEPQEATIPIDGSEAVITEHDDATGTGSVLFALIVPDTEETYALEYTLVNEQGDASEPVVTEVGP